ncbi:fumarylacetoacetate hydrolase family protein [Phenylobacterium sp.]|uniref:fumarylacetoacetate hydrolase family protein n=1 Tax=Phenylobacterium sp. TaxID=1871053 RepID=UPI002FC732B8
MKLVTFETGGARHIGAVLPDEATISDFTAASDTAHFRDMLALIDGGERALDAARALEAKPVSVRELASVRLLAPVPEPRQMFDCLCFEKHLIQSARNGHLVRGGPPVIPVNDGKIPDVYKELPVYYKCNRFSVIGAGQDVIRPRYTTKLDYEMEFGVFLGRSVKNATLEEAEKAIFGYCIFNDVSARDQQMSEMRGMLGPSKGKDFDTGNVMGPWLVTADAVDPSNLSMSVYINGEQVSSGTSADMMWSFPQIIVHSTQDETRHAGEFFGSGTVGGGCGLETGRLLKDGDILEMEVTGLGRLRNRIVFQS